MSESQTQPDVRVTNDGSLFLFRPLNDAMRQHLREGVDDEAQWFAGALVVEHRYAASLAERLVEEGFTVE